MDNTSLGRSGLIVSRLCIGGQQFGAGVDQAAVSGVLDAAEDAGINFLDTAHTYGYGLSEEFLGRALRGRRERFVIATKGGHWSSATHNAAHASRYTLIRELETSLKRLGTDYIDLYQVHKISADSPLQEIMRTLDDLVRSGKVHYLGASNFSTWQLCRCNDLASLHGWEPYASIQCHYNLLERDVEAEMAGYCTASGVGILPYFPLAGGLLAGQYRFGEAPPPGTRAAREAWAQTYNHCYGTPENAARIVELGGFARERGHSLVELAIAWLLARPWVSSVLVGITVAEQVAEDARAVEWKLSSEEMAQVDEIARARPAWLGIPPRDRWEFT